MFEFLLRCPLCPESPHPYSLPFCISCAEIPSEPLRLCGGCLEPWPCPTGCRSSLHQILAGYLSIAHTHKKIRAWKLRKSPLWDRHLLRPEILHTFDLNHDFIIPIPQNPHRSLELGGCPALHLARWLRQETGLKLQSKVFQPPELRLHQAKKDHWERWSQEIRRPLAHPKVWKQVRRHHRPTALLVDDFCTTGSTLRRHAEVLLELGFDRVDAWVLGYRPKGLHLREIPTRPVDELRLERFPAKLLTDKLNA